MSQTRRTYAQNLQNLAWYYFWNLPSPLVLRSLVPTDLCLKFLVGGGQSRESARAHATRRRESTVLPQPQVALEQRSIISTTLCVSAHRVESHRSDLTKTPHRRARTPAFLCLSRFDRCSSSCSSARRRTLTRIHTPRDAILAIQFSLWMSALGAADAVDPPNCESRISARNAKQRRGHMLQHRPGKIEARRDSELFVNKRYSERVFTG